MNVRSLFQLFASLTLLLFIGVGVASADTRPDSSSDPEPPATSWCSDDLTIGGGVLEYPACCDDCSANQCSGCNTGTVDPDGTCYEIGKIHASCKTVDDIAVCKPGDDEEDDGDSRGDLTTDDRAEKPWDGCCKKCENGTCSGCSSLEQGESCDKIKATCETVEDVPTCKPADQSDDSGEDDTWPGQASTR